MSQLDTQKAAVGIPGATILRTSAGLLVPVGSLLEGDVLQVSSGKVVGVQPTRAYFLEDAASDLAGHKVAQLAVPTDGPFTLSASIPSNPTILQSWALPAGQPQVTFIPGGTWLVHIHAYLTGGGTAHIYGTIHVHHADMSVTDLGDTGNSADLTGAETEYSLTATIADTFLASGDRLAVHIKGVKTNGNPTVNLIYAGQTGSRFAPPGGPV